MSPSQRHKHEFSGLWTHFGQYGRQDVHIHHCVADDQWNAEGVFQGACDRVIIGGGRTCSGPSTPHHRETLR